MMGHRRRTESAMSYRFNPPPNWPQPPAGWTPPQGWTPPAEWGPPPPGWQLWVDDAPVPAQPAPPPAVVVQQPVPVRATASTAVTYVPADTNHTFHLILTLVTFGLWAPVWFIVWAINSSRKKKIISHTS